LLCIKARKGLTPQCPKVEPCGVGGRIYHNLILEMCANPLFFQGNISPNFDWKNMASTYTKDFTWKK